MFSYITVIFRHKEQHNSVGADTKRQRISHVSSGVTLADLLRKTEKDAKNGEMKVKISNWVVQT